MTISFPLRTRTSRERSRRPFAFGNNGSNKTGGGTDPRAELLNLLRDGFTVANYQRGVGLTGTTDASAWANQIGVAGPLLQANGTKQPGIQPDGSLLFNGTSDFLKAAVFTLDQPLTVWFVGKQVTWTSGDRIFDGEAVNSCILFQRSASPNVSIGDATNNVDDDAQTYSLNTLAVLRCLFNGASSELSIDGATAATGNAGVNAMGGLTVGSIGTGAGNWGNIEVHEIILRSGADSAATNMRIQTLLKAIYGTP